MAQWRLILNLAALYLLAWRAWASLEVAMEDKVEVNVESEAEIPCVYITKGPTSPVTIQWFVRSGGNKVLIAYQDDSTSFVKEGTDFSGRINVLRSPGNSVLTIAKVRVTDEREFICQVSLGSSTEEGHTQLNVFNAPVDRPSIKVADYISVGTSEEIATCQVKDAYPVPSIRWYKDRSPLEHSPLASVKSSNTHNPNGLLTVESKLHLSVQLEDKDAEFYCEVTYFVPGSRELMESDHVSLTLHYPTTTLTMSVESPERLVKEGDQVEIRCQGDGSPPPVLTFSFNDDELQTGNDLLVLYNVTRADSGEYLCLLLDDLIMASNVTLTVHFMDAVVITPGEPAVLEEGHDLTLTCNALSSLSTVAKWYKDGAFFQEGHVLKLHKATFDMTGTYSCEVQASDLPELQRNSSVFVSVRGKPVITDLFEEIPLDGEAVVRLHCSAAGHPLPSISWTLSDEQAFLNEPNIKKANRVLTSSITVKMTFDNFTASCNASNPVGAVENSLTIDTSQYKTKTTTTTTASTTKAPVIPPKEKSKREGSGVIIAVIIILILLLAVLGSVLFFLYKRGKISCGRSGKQDLTKEKVLSDDIVVEMKSGKSEEAVLLQGVNGDKKIPNDQ